MIYPNLGEGNAPQNPTHFFLFAGGVSSQG